MSDPGARAAGGPGYAVVDEAPEPADKLIRSSEPGGTARQYVIVVDSCTLASIASIARVDWRAKNLRQTLGEKEPLSLYSRAIYPLARGLRHECRRQYQDHQNSH
jgi:hypothetical protein